MELPQNSQPHIPINPSKPAQSHHAALTGDSLDRSPSRRRRIHHHHQSTCSRNTKMMKKTSNNNNASTSTVPEEVIKHNQEEEDEKEEEDREEIERKIEALQKIVPGGESLGMDKLFHETAAYITDLHCQIKALTVLTSFFNTLQNNPKLGG